MKIPNQSWTRARTVSWHALVTQSTRDAVSLMYVYLRSRIYFHCAKEGHQIDTIASDPRVSFAVIDEDTVVSVEDTTGSTSVIAFGKSRNVDGEEREEAFWALVE